ncbi:MAG: choice-of-anchor J domain-containing protein [Candidatus Delongbacteria bacterium]|jgi:hypothetical protein|nr:choice-of-anchor J domain-containing protein [Candidatus Delongbacteria bacterium]
MLRIFMVGIIMISLNLSFSVTLLSEDFENMGPDASTTLPGWEEGLGYPPSTVSIENGDWYGSTFNPYNGLKAAGIYYTYADEDWLITPSINLKSTPGIDELTYWMYFEQDSGNDVNVMLSTDDGDTWDVVLKQYDGVSPDNKYEVQQVIDLSAYENETSVKIAFYTDEYDGGVSPNLYLFIDDLEIREKLGDDIKVESVYVPFTTNYIVNQAETIQAIITNPGMSNQSNFYVKCEVGSYADSILVSLNAGITDTITFVPDWTPDTAGNNNIIVTSLLATDEDTSNDIASKIVTVYPEGTGLIEGFETGIFPPVGWSTTSTEKWGESITAHNGLFSARCWGTAENEELITKPFELPGTNMLLRFWWKQSIDITDNVEVKINTGGAEWTTLKVLTDESNGNWVEEVIDLTSYSTLNAKISWNYIGDLYGATLYLDDVSVAPNFEAPEITHTEVPDDTFSNLSHTVIAEIIDYSALYSDSIYVDTGSGFSGIANDHIIGDDYYYVIPGQPDGTLIKYYFAATNVNGYRALNPVNAPSGYYEFNILPTQGVNILLDYTAVSNGEFFMEALDNNGYSYDIHDRYWNSIGFEEYQNYDLIIFSENLALEEDECVALMSFLDSGTESSVKKLMIVGDDIGYSQNGSAGSDATLYESYLKALYLGDDGIGSSSSALVPVTGDSISYNNPIFIDSAYPDAVDPDPAEPNATKVYTYPLDASYPGSSAGIKYEGLTYKTVYLPFEWDEIVTSSGTESRDNLLDRSLQWLFGYETGLEAPSNIVTSIVGTDLVIEWDTVTGATTYNVYCSNDPYGTYALDAVGSLTKPEEWTVAADQAKMFYQIKATDGTKMFNGETTITKTKSRIKYNNK